ncbi:MAG TPA: tetratricopeptide repeat protein, partial [Kofleriaceae bacterium]
MLKELARIHGENKHRDKAGDVFRKILEFVPNDTDALAFLGPQATQRIPVPPPRPTASHTATPMPAPIRAASEAAKFNITSDLPSIAPPSQRMTGSMPLVDEQSLSGVDFALPEYDDGDFSADMEPPPDPRSVSAAGEQHAEEIAKILAETDVYVKYGLHQKAVDHLRRIFGLDPENVEAHERLKDIFISQGREQEAEVELMKLAELVAPG